MSYPFLTTATLNLLALLGLHIWIRSRYEMALTSVDEKSAGMLFFYRNNLSDVLHGRFNSQSLGCLFHYLALHLAVPLLGLGFFLRSDINFLVIIAALFTSMQLFQRTYPGKILEEDEDS